MLSRHHGEVLSGAGASPEGTDKGWGNRPFLDLRNLDTGERERLWQSSPPYFESTSSLLVDSNSDAPITCGPLASPWPCHHAHA